MGHESATRPDTHIVRGKQSVTGTDCTGNRLSTNQAVLNPGSHHSPSAAGALVKHLKAGGPRDSSQATYPYRQRNQSVIGSDCTGNQLSTNQAVLKSGCHTQEVLNPGCHHSPSAAGALAKRSIAGGPRKSSQATYPRQRKQQQGPIAQAIGYPQSKQC
jgi:hypothetical protein